MDQTEHDNADAPALFGLMAGAMALVAIAAAVVALVSDLPGLALIPAVIAAVLGAVVIWMNSTMSRLSARLRGVEHENIRLEAAAAAAPAETAAQAANAEPVSNAPSAILTPAGAIPLGSLDVSDTSDLADSETGLLGERYFVVTLGARVAAARRHLRPLALVLLEAVTDATTNPVALDARASAEIIRETLRDADTLCRLQNGHFAILLEDTPENGAIWTVERIRRRLTEHVDEATIWAGIACYPANGFDGPEVLDRARSALTSAREWRQDRTEVAEA